jgi:hypothetical protein
VTPDELTRLVRTAHGDAWEAEGRLRERFGGGAARARGARLMASGIPRAQWNNADVTDAHPDLDAVTAWYGSLDVPWGLRVPLELDVDLGTPLFVKRCVGVAARRFHPHPPDETVVRAATPADDYAALDAHLFGGDLAESRLWVDPERASDRFRHWIGERDGEAVAIGTALRTDGEAGPAVYVTGLAGRPDACAALAGAAAADAFAGGAALVHANPDDDAEAALWTALGALEVPGFQVRVVRVD